jgi:hypothetical protein
MLSGQTGRANNLSIMFDLHTAPGCYVQTCRLVRDGKDEKVTFFFLKTWASILFLKRRLIFLYGNSKYLDYIKMSCKLRKAIS